MAILDSGITNESTNRTLCVYRYTDIEDRKIKYVGIVTKGKLSSRLANHNNDDEWCIGKKWYIEYFECGTRSEAEAFEAHLIALYGTGEYYNTHKAKWGLNSFLPDVEKWWKPATIPLFEDFETMEVFWRFKKAVKDQNYEEAMRLFESLEVIRE